MRVIAKSTLVRFWESEPKHLVAKSSLEAWHAEVLKATWSDPHQIKEQYKNASILKNGRVVFNIKGNDYRLITEINYDHGIVYIRWVGTHKEYDKLNAETVKCR